MKTEYRFNEVSHVVVSYSKWCHVGQINVGEKYTNLHGNIEDCVAEADEYQKWRIFSMWHRYKAKERRYRYRQSIGTIGFILDENKDIYFDAIEQEFKYKPYVVVYFLDGEKYIEYFGNDSTMNVWLEEKFPNLNTKITQH